MISMFLLFSVFPPRQNKARHENKNSKAHKMMKIWLPFTCNSNYSMVMLWDGEYSVHADISVIYINM